MTMGKMKELAIALRNGDSLSDLSEAERDYVSGLTPEEYDAARGKADYSFDTYQDYRHWIEQEVAKRGKTVPSEQQENKGNSAQ